MQAMSTNIASQLRLAADIYETGHPFETAPRQGGLWCLPMKHERDVMRWPLDKWEIRLVLATPPDSRPLHNPENLTAEQVGAGWRLTLKGEMVPKSGKAQWWTGMEWVKSDGGYVPTGNPCRLPLSTPWPEAEKPDPLTAIRLAYEAGKPVQYRNANSSGAWSQWHDYDGGKDMSAPMPIDPHGGYREWRVKPEAPPFQLPVEGA